MPGQYREEIGDHRRAAPRVSDRGGWLAALVRWLQPNVVRVGPYQ